MRKTIVATLLMVALPSAAAAGEIFGTAAPNVANLEVRVVCGDQSLNTFTDARGSYRLYVPRSAECKLTVRRGPGNWSEPLTIYSSDKPGRYDFQIKGNRLERQ
jgi:hypothetical protein